MSKQNLSLLITVLFVLVIILSLTVWLIQKKQNVPLPTKPVDVNLPTPTTIEVRTTIPPTPAGISPTSTGVFEEELPKEIQDLADQKQALKAKTPLTEINFIITFDYGEDKFIVQLQDPKPESQTKFKEWLQANFPAIPIDRFIIK